MEYELAELFTDETWLFTENAYSQTTITLFYDIKIAQKFAEILFNLRKANS